MTWFHGQPAFADSANWPAPRVRVIEAEFRALKKYQPSVYPGQITLFRASRQPLVCSYEPTKGWQRLTVQEVQITQVPGSHHTMIEEPHVRALASVLTSSIDAAAAGEVQPNQMDRLSHETPSPIQSRATAIGPAA
jgi:hypothetical protein